MKTVVQTGSAIMISSHTVSLQIYEKKDSLKEKEGDTYSLQTRAELQQTRRFKPE